MRCEDVALLGRNYSKGAVELIFSGGECLVVEEI